MRNLEINNNMDLDLNAYIQIPERPSHLFPKRLRKLPREIPYSV